MKTEILRSCMQRVFAEEGIEVVFDMEDTRKSDKVRVWIPCDSAAKGWGTDWRGIL